MARVNYLISILILFYSCKEEIDFRVSKSLNDRFPRAYQANEFEYFIDGIRCKGLLKSNEKGDSILLAILIENKTNDSVYFNPGELQLSNSKNSRSDIFWNSQNSALIPAHSIDTLLFTLSPINNNALFERTKYRGDLDSLYKVSLSFVYNQGKPIFNETFEFRLDKLVYQNYMENQAIEKRISLFQFKNRNEIQMAFKNYFEKINEKAVIKNESNSIQISNSDIMIRGAVIRLDFYSIDSILMLNLKIINHGSQVLKLNPFMMKVILQNQMLTPQVLYIQDRILLDKEYYYINRGARLEMELNYGLIANEEFKLSDLGIYYSETNQKLLQEPIELILDSTYVE